MRIKRINRGYTLFLRDAEFGILTKLASTNIDDIWGGMTTSERKSWAQRIRNGDFLRIDQDQREY